jgi:hypothetical protein
MQAFVTHVALVVVLPALACAALLMIAWQPWRRPAAVAGGRWGGMVALATCMGLAIGLNDGWPAFPPRESWQWLAYLAIAAAAWGSADTSVRLRPSARIAGRLILAGAAAWLLTGTWVDRYWLWRVIAFATIAALTLGLTPIAPRARGATTPIILALGAAGASVLLVLGGNAKLSEMAGALAVGLGFATVLAWWRPTVDLGPGGIITAAILVPGLLLSGWYASYSEVPAWCYFVVALAPLGVWVGELRVFADWPPWRRVVVRALFVVLCLALPLGRAVSVAMSGETW